MVLAKKWLRTGIIPIIVALAMVVVGGCATAPSGTTRPTHDSRSHAVSNTRHAVVDAARQAIGTPYRYGGDSPRGFDCSGLVQYAHRQVGVRIPRTTDSQWRSARSPHRRYLLPGDVLFFSLGGDKDRHVGIYEGDGVFIHAPSSGKRVGRASLDNPYWQDHLVAAKTFL